MTVLVVAPHPDDETLGCGGTLLRHRAAGEDVHWLIVTDMHVSYGFTQEQVAQRREQIAKVAAAYGFRGVHNLGMPPAQLETLPISDLVARIGAVVKQTAPQVVYAPFYADVHTDHDIVFDAVAACVKWFRYPSVRRVLCYETLSETDQSLLRHHGAFVANSFVDVAPHLDRKIEIAQLYAGEMGEFPFPRSAQALRALAQVRGAGCGAQAAEAFMLLREIMR